MIEKKRGMEVEVMCKGVNILMDCGVQPRTREKWGGEKVMIESIGWVVTDCSSKPERDEGPSERGTFETEIWKVLQ